MAFRTDFSGLSSVGLGSGLGFTFVKNQTGQARTVPVRNVTLVRLLQIEWCSPCGEIKTCSLGDHRVDRARVFRAEPTHSTASMRVTSALLLAFSIVVKSHVVPRHAQLSLARPSLTRPSLTRSVRPLLSSVPGTSAAAAEVEVLRTFAEVPPPAGFEWAEKVDVATCYPPKPSLRECFGFALPALGIYTAGPLMSLIDAAFVGRASSLELAALGPASSISDSAPMPLLFLSIGATNLIATSSAAGDEAASSLITKVGLALGTIGGLAIAAGILAYATPLSTLYCGGTAPLVSPCARYVLIRAIALPAVVFSTVAQAVCIGIKDTKTPMYAVALAAAANFCGDLVLVNGLGRGLAGAAWATTASQLAAAGLLLLVLGRRGLLGRGGGGGGVDGVDRPAPAPAPTRRELWQVVTSLLSFVPFLFVMAIKMGVHNGAAATAAALGGSAAAAHTALFATAMLCFTFGDVGSSLAQAYLPAFSVASAPSAGSPPPPAPVRKTFDVAASRPTLAQLLRCTLCISATVVAISTAIITRCPGQFTRDVAVVQQMAAVLPLMATTLALHGTAVTLEGVLLAQKAFRALALTYSVVGVGVAAAFTCIRRAGAAGPGLLAIWSVYACFQAFRIAAFSILGGLLPRLRARPWRTAAK